MENCKTNNLQLQLSNLSNFDIREWFTLGAESNTQHPKRIDVHRIRVLHLAEHFRGLVSRGTEHSGALDGLKLTCIKVCKLEIAIFHAENVGKFDISVDQLPFLKVFQCACNLNETSISSTHVEDRETERRVRTGGQRGQGGQGGQGGQRTGRTGRTARRKL